MAKTRLALLALFALACRRTPTPPPARPRTPVQVTPVPAAPPDPCARAIAAQRALFAGLPVPPGEAPASPEFATCIPTPRGAWSLEIESLRWVADEQAWRGHWSLVHADSAGRLVRIALSLPADVSVVTVVDGDLDLADHAG